jgi:hypothetical protein
MPVATLHPAVGADKGSLKAGGQIAHRLAQNQLFGTAIISTPKVGPVECRFGDMREFTP